MTAMSTDVERAVAELRRALARAAFATFTGDVTRRQANVLRELRASGPMSQVRLARATGSEQSSVVRALDDLEKNGLVERHRGKTDRRKKIVSLTPKGRAALGPLDGAHRRLARAAEADLNAEERAQFVALSAKIVRSLDAVAERAGAAEELAPTCGAEESET
ncbi:MAG: Transcriptional regulator SlyA [Planctomycetes bacterium]|nr:Transcriptional regulator SlyA [Planctomycetota bacterium]